MKEISTKYKNCAHTYECINTVIQFHSSITSLSRTDNTGYRGASLKIGQLKSLSISKKLLLMVGNVFN